MGLLGSFFNFVDPILDTIDPLHNKVQTWTTGSSTTKGQSPYFQAIAPMVVDAFLPGVGSAIGAADGASTGNWGKAALGALGAYGQLGSVGSAAADTASGGLAASEATQASTGLASTGGDAAGVVTTAAPVEASASNFGAANNFGQTNELGYTGMSSMSGAPESSQFMTLPAADYASAGGAGQSLGTTTAESSRLASTGLLGNTAKTPAYGKMAGQMGAEVLKQQAQADENARRRAEMQRMQSQQAMAAGGGIQEPSRGPVASFQSVSPYAQFNGGFSSRPVRRGLFGG